MKELPEVSEFESALVEYNTVIRQDILDDIGRRGVQALPLLSGSELQLADTLTIGYLKRNDPVREAVRPDINVDVYDLVIDGLILARRSDQLARLPAVERSLVPAAAVDYDQIKSYADGLFEDYLLYAVTRPNAAKLAENLPNWVDPLPSMGLRIPFKERRRLSLKHQILSSALLMGFTALDKVQLAEEEDNSRTENWPVDVVKRVRDAEIIET